MPCHVFISSFTKKKIWQNNHLFSLLLQYKTRPAWDPQNYAFLNKCWQTERKHLFTRSQLSYTLPWTISVAPYTNTRKKTTTQEQTNKTKTSKKIQAKMFQAHKMITWMLKFYAWLWRSCEALESVQCQSKWWGWTPRLTSITPAHLNLRQTPALGPRAVGSGSGGQGPSWAPQRAGQRRSQSTQQRGKTERSNTCQHAQNVGSSVDIMTWPTKAKIKECDKTKRKKNGWWRW